MNTAVCACDCVFAMHVHVETMYCFSAYVILFAIFAKIFPLCC